MKTEIKWNSFKYSVKRSIPILIGFFPVGIAYGILMAEAGYNFVWSFFSSLFVYAGSLQMLMVSFFSGGIPVIVIAVTSLLLNSRHIFYGISFIDKFKKYGIWKWFLIYGLTDESYSLLCSYKDTEDVDEKWVHIFSTGLIWSYWVVFSTVGGLIGQLITFDTTGIDFALTALFVVIFVEQIKESKTKVPGVIGIVSSVLCIILLGPENFLLPSLLITVMALILTRGYLEVKCGKEAKE